MEELDAEEKAFQNKFSRQIATMGLAAVRKLVKMKVLIVGCGGVGAETAKNVILQGTRAVTLYDPVCHLVSTICQPRIKKKKLCVEKLKRIDSIILLT